jgi:hypothetical protein
VISLAAICSRILDWNASNLVDDGRFLNITRDLKSQDIL